MLEDNLRYLRNKFKLMKISISKQHMMGGLIKVEMLEGREEAMEKQLCSFFLE